MGYVFSFIHPTFTVAKGQIFTAAFQKDKPNYEQFINITCVINIIKIFVTFIEMLGKKILLLHKYLEKTFIFL